MQHTSAIVAVGLIGSTLLTYAMTVYNQQLWNRQYRQLETLQRHKRDLIATHETLKHQLAQEAEQENNGLVTPQPTHTIFLPATGKQSFRKPTPIPSSQKSFSQAPIGY
jgi:beta-lactamase regulating signal transducer with metallopeptidase domain